VLCLLKPQLSQCKVTVGGPESVCPIFILFDYGSDYMDERPHSHFAVSVTRLKGAINFSRIMWMSSI